MSDELLLLRHGRWAVALLPLVVATLTTWFLLTKYWWDAWTNGYGEPLDVTTAHWHNSLQGPKRGEAHPSGVHTKWSAVYIFVQQCQGCKFIFWLVCMSAATTDCVPEVVRRFVELQELLDERPDLIDKMSLWQLLPFGLCKARQLVASWLSHFVAVQFLCYNIFNSYLEVAVCVLVDNSMLCWMTYQWFLALRYDWVSQAQLHRLRNGEIEIVGKPKVA